MKAEITANTDRNLKRVRAIIRVYSGLRTPGKGRRRVDESDILRAAVVFLHATLEDFLRSVELWKLPSATADILDGIPLSGTGNKGRAEKFLLGKLAAHRGKRVDEVIEESVAEHLERSNYNNTPEIISTLRGVGVDHSKFSTHFASLESLMKRRHNIVHRADENESAGRGHFGAKSISVTAVEAWIETVEMFTAAVLNEL